MNEPEGRDVEDVLALIRIGHRLDGREPERAPPVPQRWFVWRAQTEPSDSGSTR